jgi:succinate dehydrogenase flavoprotein subunit
MSSSFDTQDADFLVIGGGFAGCWAALRGAQLGQRVILIDKAFISRSGASTISGGVTTCPLDSDNLDDWVEEFVVRGGYMCDQDWTRQLLEGQRERVKDLAAWNVPISRDDNGQIRRFASRGMVTVRCMQYRPKTAMEALRREAIAHGVQILDRVFISDLLTSDGRYPTQGRICGAIGFHTRNGRPIVFRAKTTLLATGMIAMKGVHHVDNDTGDGAAMGYRAGARLTDLEFGFGGTFSWLMKHLYFGSYNVAVAHGARLINAAGERFMEKYDPVRFERSELARVVAAFTKEIVDGRGPVYVDLRNCDESYWRDLASVQTAKGASAILSPDIPDPRKNPLPIEPTWGLWNGGRSGIKIDIDCQSNIPGLLAAGAAAKNDATGTHASAGIPTAFAMNSGFHAGETAARRSRMTDLIDAPADRVEELIAHLMEPLGRPSPLTPDDLHDRLSLMETDIVQSVNLSAGRLNAFIDQAEELRRNIPLTGARDLHDLVKLHEARNVAECALLVYRSSLDRTESREQFYREDYPETDDDNWFCWHGTRRTEAGVAFDRERIPLEKWPLQPTKKPRHISPIAAIMRGSFDPALYG